MKKRIKAFLLLIVFILGLVNPLIMEVAAAEESAIQSIKNSIVELLVNKKDGRFVIKTVDGSPNREDENEPLLFIKDMPQTSFTTIRIDGEDYIYGNTYVSPEGGFLENPVTNGMSSNSIWKIGDIAVAQRLELTDNISSSDVGNVKISYTIKNEGSIAKEVGARILLDMMLGDNDGCIVSLDGKKDISYEEKVSKKNIPLYWRCTDAVDNPKVVAYGFVKGWGNVEPDSMTIAHWSALSGTKWDYIINPERNIGSSLNDYKSADSAAALYWEPKVLSPGETMLVETFYGLGNVNGSDGNAFDLNVIAPAKLTVSGENYKDNPFHIMMELDNSLNNSMELAGITAELILPEGLELVAGGESSLYFYKIPAKYKQTAQWEVNALKTDRLRVLQYMIKVSRGDEELKTVRKFIIVPGFGESDSQIGYTDLIPGTLYYGDEDKAVQLLGYGFEILKDKSSYEMSLSDVSKGIIHNLKETDITVVSDNQIRIKIPKDMEQGEYKLTINHRNDLYDYTLANTITITMDSKYKSRNYGILAIMEESTGGNTVHKAKLFENEGELSAEDKSKAIFILRGKIKNISEGKFDVYGDSIGINNVYFKGYGDKTLSVNKSGNSYIVKGTGELYMPTAFMGKTMDITLKKGSFYIDSKTAVIKDEEGYLNDTSMLYVGYFPILVKEIKIQKNGEAKIDGLLKLENKYFEFLAGAMSGFMESDLKDMSITNKNINIDAEIKLPFPRWKLGGFQSKDYVSKKTTNITFFINTIKGAYGFKTKAENPGLRLLDINATMVFDKNLYPDYFEFDNEYGKIPEPIGSTGLAFERVGGGIYGLRSMIDSLRYGILPTGSSIVARADIADLLTYHSGRIKGKTLLGLRDMEAVLSCTGLDLKGDAYVYFIDVGDIIGHFDFGGGYIQSNINILDILIMDSYFGVSSREIRASMSGKLKIPKYVWFVGGEEVGSYKSELSSKKIEGSVKVLGVGVGVKYEWGGSVSFSVASVDAIGEKGIYTVRTTDEKGRDVKITYGTNIEKISDIPYSYNICYSGDIGGVRLLGASEYTYKLDIKDMESAIIEMKYESLEVPEIIITDPDGIFYELTPGVNYKNHIVSAEESESGLEEKRLFVTIINPMDGKWKIASDKAVTMKLYNAIEPATFKSLEAEFKEDKIKVDWSLNTNLGSKVSLHLIKEGEASGYVELGKDLDGSLGSYECAIPEGVTTGKYKVRGEVKRDGTGYDYMDSTAFEITDALAPAAPTGFTVTAIGNGLMKAKWNSVAGVDEYRLYAVDNKGALDSTVLAMVSVEGDKTETIFGGTQKDEKGNEYGWFPGRNYNFALYAIKQTGDDSSKIDHISKGAYSEAVELPRPKPPVFTASFSSLYGNVNIEKDENNEDVYYTNSGNITCNFEADKTSDIVIYINGEKVGGRKSKNYDFELYLKDCENFIEIEATGENGDKSVKVYDFYYDNTEPDLMVQSPSSGDLIQDGRVTVSGVTSPNCRLYINGTPLTVEEDGSFNEEYMLMDEYMETLKIQSVDKAGNEAEYVTEVYNSGVGSFVRVEIRPNTMELWVGDKIQLKLYGVAEDGKSVLLDGNRVDWQLYDTESIATLTEKGLLTGIKVGEVVVNAGYRVSEDKIFEDAIVIKVLPKEDKEKDKDKDRDRDKDSSKPVPPSNIENDKDKDNKGEDNKISMIDMDNHWAKDLVNKLIEKGIINGIKTPSGEYRFEPERDVTRAEFAKLLSLSHGYVQNDRDMDLSSFADEEDIQPWAKPYMKYCYDLGWIKGKSDGKVLYMKPKDAITRAEGAVMVARALGLAADTKTLKTKYIDNVEIPDWALSYINRLTEMELMTGYSDGTFRPAEILTRAEGAALLYKCFVK